MQGFDVGVQLDLSIRLRLQCRPFVGTHGELDTVGTPAVQETVYGSLAFSGYRGRFIEKKAQTGTILIQVGKLLPQRARDAIERERQMDQWTPRAVSMD